MTPILRELIRDYFSGSEWFLTFEVGNSTGFSVSRHADAVAMNLWPSRGLSFHGIEIKASRTDWRKELGNPAKAEEIHQHCDFWWLVAANGVVKDINEIPPGWGFMELSKPASGGDDDKRPRLRMRRQASKLERVSLVKREFVAGILRAQQRADGQEKTEAIERGIAASLERRVENELSQRRMENSASVERLKCLEAAFSSEGLKWLLDEEICRAVSFVLKHGVTSAYEGIAGLISKFDEVSASAGFQAERLRDAAERAGILIPKDPDQAILPLRRRA